MAPLRCGRVACAAGQRPDSGHALGRTSAVIGGKLLTCLDFTLVKPALRLALFLFQFVLLGQVSPD